MLKYIHVTAALSQQQKTSIWRCTPFCSFTQQQFLMYALQVNTWQQMRIQTRHIYTSTVYTYRWFNQNAQTEQLKNYTDLRRAYTSLVLISFTLFIITLSLKSISILISPVNIMILLHTQLFPQQFSRFIWISQLPLKCMEQIFTDQMLYYTSALPYVQLTNQCSDGQNAYIHNGNYPGELGLTGCPNHFPSPTVVKLTPSHLVFLKCLLCLSYSACPISIIITFSMSIQSQSPNQLVPISSNSAPLSLPFCQCKATYPSDHSHFTPI